MLRGYGWYSNKWREMRKEAAAEASAEHGARVRTALPPQFLGDGWRADALNTFGIDVRIVEIDDRVRRRVAEAQVR